jgi:hypothetical protein
MFSQEVELFLHFSQLALLRSKLPPLTYPRDGSSLKLRAFGAWALLQSHLLRLTHLFMVLLGFPHTSALLCQLYGYLLPNSLRTRSLFTHPSFPVRLTLPCLCGLTLACQPLLPKPGCVSLLDLQLELSHASRLCLFLRSALHSLLSFCCTLLLLCDPSLPNTACRSVCAG